jgi:hypothetical protein
MSDVEVLSVEAELPPEMLPWDEQHDRRDRIPPAMLMRGDVVHAQDTSGRYHSGVLTGIVQQSSATSLLFLNGAGPHDGIAVSDLEEVTVVRSTNTEARPILWDQHRRSLMAAVNAHLLSLQAVAQRLTDANVETVGLVRSLTEDTEAAFAAEPDHTEEDTDGDV